MISWLLGSTPPSWKELDEIFKDYISAIVYVNKEGKIDTIKISDVLQYYYSASVFVRPKYLRILKPIYIKHPNFVAFPTLNENVYKNLIKYAKWRAYIDYQNNEFLGAWILYDCNIDGDLCREKQYFHIQINESFLSLDKIVKYHLLVFNNEFLKAREVLYQS